MKNLLVIFIVAIFASCSHDFPEFDPKPQAVEALGFTYDSSHTWCTTSKGSMTINIPQGYIEAKVMSLIKDGEEEPYLVTLTSTSKSGVVYYDIPDENLGIYVAYFDKDGRIELERAQTRGVRRSQSQENDVVLPDVELELAGSKESYASKRGWNPGELLYYSDPDCGGSISVSNYASEVAENIQMIIFSHFKNGKQYNNLSLIKESGIYNENSYPITTGEEKPILVSPIYRNDGKSKEVENSELYYYYFPMNQNPSVEDIMKLPKYRAMKLRGNIKDNGVLEKFCSYALVYWNGETGSYYFPEGYKIGFMLQSNVSEGNGAKQGELYCDGRLNTKINKYGYFKNSGMSETDPRMAWLTIGGRDFLCCESGVDKDMNDLILEVEGSVDVPEVIPEFEANYYTFCFEDSKVGDYDLNDIVISGRRLSDTKVEYCLMACGAHDELYIGGVNGKRIIETREAHEILGKTQRIFINTESLDTEFVRDTVNVIPEFSFLDNQPYIYNKTKGYNVYISRVGEDPHAIMIPSYFKWSKERICIKDSYLLFGNWGRNKVESTDWYLYPVEGKVVEL